MLTSWLPLDLSTLCCSMTLTLLNMNVTFISACTPYPSPMWARSRARFTNGFRWKNKSGSCYLVSTKSSPSRWNASPGNMQVGKASQQISLYLIPSCCSYFVFIIWLGSMFLAGLQDIPSFQLDKLLNESFSLSVHLTATFYDTSQGLG